MNYLWFFIFVIIEFGHLSTFIKYYHFYHTSFRFLFCMTFHTKNINYAAWNVSKYGVLLVRIFPYSDWVRGDENAGKHRPEKTPYFYIFHAVLLLMLKRTPDLLKDWNIIWNEIFGEC